MVGNWMAEVECRRFVLPYQAGKRSLMVQKISEKRPTPMEDLNAGRQQLVNQSGVLTARVHAAFPNHGPAGQGRDARSTARRRLPPRFPQASSPRDTTGACPSRRDPTLLEGDSNSSNSSTASSGVASRVAS